MSSKKDKEIAKAKYIVGTPIQQIADYFKVDPRTIQRWAKEGKWSELRQNNQPSNVVSFVQKPKVDIGRAIAQLTDNLELINATLMELHAALPEAVDGAKGGIASAIARLIELKRKIKPESIAELADRAIELGFGPDDFLAELKNAWQRRA